MKSGTSLSVFILAVFFIGPWVVLQLVEAACRCKLSGGEVEVVLGMYAIVVALVVFVYSFIRESNFLRKNSARDKTAE